MDSNEFEKEYITDHQKKQQKFLDELKILLNKHMPMLYEEQYFAVWNESPLSKEILPREEVELFLKSFNMYNEGFDLYYVLSKICIHLGIEIPGDFETPEHLR